MEAIPVLGTAIVNTPWWIYRLFYSIDYPVEHFVVFNNNGRGQIDRELDLLKSVPHKYVKNVHVCHLPANVGCSGAWNLIIKTFMNSPYWVITNHDLMYEPGFLKACAEKMADGTVGITHGNHGSWDFFAIRDWVVDKYGLFDENLYPAYCEDLDYGMRFQHDDLKRELSVGVGYYHGEKKNSYEDGSQTWRSEPQIAQAIHIGHEYNKQYLNHKWGEGWQAHIDEPTYETPFDKSDLPKCFTTYKLSFVRRKNLGF